MNESTTQLCSHRHNAQWNNKRHAWYSMPQWLTISLTSAETYGCSWEARKSVDAPVPEYARLERCKLHILHVLHILIYCIYWIFMPYMQYCKDILLQGGRPFPYDAMLKSTSKILPLFFNISCIVIIIQYQDFTLKRLKRWLYLKFSPPPTTKIRTEEKFALPWYTKMIMKTMTMMMMID